MTALDNFVKVRYKPTSKIKKIGSVTVNGKQYPVNKLMMGVYDNETKLYDLQVIIQHQGKRV